MSPAVKYTLGRIGLFVAVLLILWPFPLDLLVKLMIALVVSFALSWFLLRGWRDEMSRSMADSVERRRAERAKLRSALAGDDRPTDDRPTDDRPSGDGRKSGNDGNPDEPAS